jgi:hypothetical protein
MRSTRFRLHVGIEGETRKRDGRGERGGPPPPGAAAKKVAVCVLSGSVRTRFCWCRPIFGATRPRRATRQQANNTQSLSSNP